MTHRGDYRAVRREQEEEVRKLYAEGLSANALSKKFNCSGGTITAVLRRNGASVRSWRVLSVSQVDEMVRRWDAGESRNAIASVMGSKGETVDRALRARGRAPVSRRPSAISSEQEQELIRLHNEGVSMATLEERYGCSRPTIYKALRRNGVAVAPPGRTRWRTFSDEQVDEMVRRWDAGESQSAIAKSFDTTQVIIGRALLWRGRRPERRTNHSRGPAHGSWKGGRIRWESGYVGIKVDPDDPMFAMATAGGYVPEHRLVMARSIGRVLTHHETVHHINGVRDDNDISNLQLRTTKHGSGVIMQCLDCGSRNVVATALD